MRRGLYRLRSPHLQRTRARVERSMVIASQNNLASMPAGMFYLPLRRPMGLVAIAIACLFAVKDPQALASERHHHKIGHSTPRTSRRHSPNPFYRSSDGSLVHIPTPAPIGAYGEVTAICRDGTVSYSHHSYARGTCSHHGGVAHWRP